MKRATKTELFLLVLIGLSAGVLVAVRIFFSDFMSVSYSQDNFTPYGDSEAYLPTFEISLKVSDKKAIVLINGEPVSLNEADGLLYTLTLTEADVVELDLRALKDKEAYAYVASVPEGVNKPVSGSKIIGKGGIILLFKVECE